MQIIDVAQNEIKKHGLKISHQDLSKPWGCFFVFDDTCIENFIKVFFNDLPTGFIFKNENQKLSPKFLVLNPNKKLSWQYHLRRSEIWKVIYGKAGVVKSFTDEENDVVIYTKNHIVILEKEERHRLISFDEPCIIAEIWQHSDDKNLSDENDIIRLKDDFGR